MAQPFGALYYEGYETLLRNTDEKQVFIDNLGGFIEQYGVTSLLDIGAGDGDLALPLSEKVETYVAVEQNPEYAARLTQAGKKVVEQLFPSNDIQGSYDLVVMSHVVSHTAGNHNTLVPAAWELVNPDGHLLIATHRSNTEDDWGKLLEIVGQTETTEHMAQSYDDMIAKLGVKGMTEVQRVITVINTQSMEDMMTALAFRASNGEADRHSSFMSHAERVTQLLYDSYRREDGFYFPFGYLFVSTHKAAHED